MVLMCLCVSNNVKSRPGALFLRGWHNHSSHCLWDRGKGGNIFKNVELTQWAPCPSLRLQTFTIWGRFMELYSWSLNRGCPKATELSNRVFELSTVLAMELMTLTVLMLQRQNRALVIQWPVRNVWQEKMPRTNEVKQTYSDCISNLYILLYIWNHYFGLRSNEIIDINIGHHFFQTKFILHAFFVNVFGVYEYDLHQIGLPWWLCPFKKSG